MGAYNWKEYPNIFVESEFPYNNTSTNLFQARAETEKKKNYDLNTIISECSPVVIIQEA